MMRDGLTTLSQAASCQVQGVGVVVRVLVVVRVTNAVAP